MKSVRWSLRLIAIPLLSAVLLSGCGAGRLINPVVVPESMLRCQDKPPKPVSFNDVEMAVTLILFDAAHRDCQTSLGEVGDLLREQGAVR